MIIDSVAALARENPSSLALAFHVRGSTDVASLSWKELWDQVVQVGTALAARLDPGDRLLLVFPQGLAFHICQLACHYAGCVPIPVPLPDNKASLERLSGVAEDSDCAAILTAAKFRDDLCAICGDRLVISAEDLLAERPSAIAPPYRAAEDDIAFIQYTSGSVGTPKGLVVSHGNLIANLRMLSEGRREDLGVIVCWVPHFHDMGLIGNFYLALFVGAELHLCDAADFVRQPLSWVRLLSSTRATYTTVPHFALKLCSRVVHLLQPGEVDLSPMRWLCNSSEPIDWEGLAEFESAFAPFGLTTGAVVPHYGLAECTVLASYVTESRPRYLDVDRDQFVKGNIALAEDHASAQRIINCGRGLVDCDFAIVDPETRRRHNPDRIGEIWISGSHVARGYWGKPELTAEIFDQAIAGEPGDTRYVRSGDLGFVHEGDLYITGRMKDLIIIRGQNYYARDIEILAERASPFVRGGRVVAIPLDRSGQETIGILAEVSEDFDYRNHAQDFVHSFSRLLAEHFGLSPSAIVIVSKHSLPRTTSGKIQRVDAKRLFEGSRLRPLFQFEPTQPLSAADGAAGFPGLQNQKLLRTWLVARLTALSGIPAISDQSDLFELGVDSLGMTNFILELEDVAQTSLLDERFYESPTLATLIQLLAGEPDSGPGIANDEPQQTQGIAPPKARTFKQRLSRHLRDRGPIWGPLRLAYGPGSRLLDHMVKSNRLQKRLSTPFLARLNGLIEEQGFEDSEKLKYDVARSYNWSGWRESCLSDPGIFAEYVTVKGIEYIQAAQDAGRGIILAMMHSRLKGLPKFIPELASRTIGAIANLPPERLEFYGMGDLAYKTGAFASRTIPSARVAQIHNAHRLLAKGDTVIMFMDTYEGVGGIAVPFLGRQRPIRPGIGELALDTGATILPLQPWLHDDGRMTLELKEPLQASGVSREEQLLSLMTQQVVVMETMWRENPGQMDAEAMKLQLDLPPA